MLKNDSDAHMENINDVNKNENYQNVCICRNITVYDKCLNEDGDLYQDQRSVGKEKEKHTGLV